MFIEVLLEALIDSVKMLPFLFAAYLIIEYIERHHGESIERVLAGGGRWGCFAAAVLGCVPQCGFSAAAATFKRGINFINIPTSLLGMVDASVGGKTGVNFGGLKNEIGVFAEAHFVLLCADFLATLDPATMTLLVTH